MNRIIKNFIAKLDNHGVEYRLIPDNQNVIVMEDSLQQNSSVTVRIGVMCENDADIFAKIIYSGIGTVDNPSLKFHKALNDFNETYRFFKMSVNCNGNIEVCYDMYIGTNEIPVDDIFRMILLGSKLIDDAYPSIMRGIWS